MTENSEQAMLLDRTKAIVARYRREMGTGDRPLSFAQFAQLLGSFGQKISYQSIKNWEDGVHAPDAIFLVHLLDSASTDTWQWRFAWEILTAYSEW